MPDELIAIAKLLRPVGLDGLCAVESFGKTLELLEIPFEVRVGLNGDETQKVLIEEIQSRPKGFICRFKGINNLQSAEQLKGYLIFIDTQQLPSLGTEEFYHFELKGMTVFSDSNQRIGVVVDVHNYPTTDSLEVKRNNGELILLPMNKDSIVTIEKEEHRIVVKQDFLEELL